MSLRLGDAIGNGANRAFSKSGGLLMALMIGYQLVFLTALYTVFAELLPPAAQQDSAFALTLPVPVAVAAGIAAIGLLFGIVLYLAATRALTRPPADLDTLPTEMFTRRMGRAVVSAIAANIVVSIAVLIGFILLVVPGIYLAISFAFVVFAIGVEDQRAIDSLRRSWALATGDRWQLLALLLVVAVITGIGSSIGSVASIINPLAGELLSIGLTGVFSILSYGILAEAYVQLSESKPPDSGGESPDSAVEPEPDSAAADGDPMA